MLSWDTILEPALAIAGDTEQTFRTLDHKCGCLKKLMNLADWVDSLRTRYIKIQFILKMASLHVTAWVTEGKSAISERSLFHLSIYLLIALQVASDSGYYTA